MKYSALIGDPTDHSVSHLMYRELARAAGIASPYEHIRLNVQRTELDASLRALNTLHFVGLNVTLPYKLDVIEHLDTFDPVIKVLGAVNTIKLGEKTQGFNTDWVGIAESIKKLGASDDYKTATIFGTGGAARAAIYACKQLGIDNIKIAYRADVSESTRKLREQSEELGVTLHPYSEVGSLIKNSQLVINATSAGMIGKDPLPFDLKLLQGASMAGKVFIDAVFNPLETPLLKYFQSEGATTIDGLWMMIHQGCASLSIWLDQKISVDQPELEKIHNMLEKELKNA